MRCTMISSLVLFLTPILALTQHQHTRHAFQPPTQRRGNIPLFRSHIIRHDTPLNPRTALHASSTPPPPPSSTPLQSLETIDIEPGTGATAKFESIVTVRYTGRILSPSSQPQLPFDTNTISFKLGTGKVLEGCDKGIRGMRVGGTRIIRIPYRMGFGEGEFEGPDYTIPPRADVEYEVVLRDVVEGWMAEVAAKAGIGLDRDTVYLK